MHLQTRSYANTSSKALPPSTKVEFQLCIQQYVSSAVCVVGYKQHTSSNYETQGVSVMAAAGLLIKRTCVPCPL
jgi:hypothetical protein